MTTETTKQIDEANNKRLILFLGIGVFAIMFICFVYIMHLLGYFRLL